MTERCLSGFVPARHHALIWSSSFCSIFIPFSILYVYLMKVPLIQVREVRRFLGMEMTPSHEQA
jgi:hypothetical protein